MTIRARLCLGAAPDVSQSQLLWRWPIGLGFSDENQAILPTYHTSPGELQPAVGTGSVGMGTFTSGDDGCLI